MRWLIALAIGITFSLFSLSALRGEQGRVQAAAATPSGVAYLTHVSTDKPVYRSGETVYLRGVVLGAAGHAPVVQGQSLGATVQILGPKGDVISSGYVPAEVSVVAFNWPVPDGQAGGEYTAKFTYPQHGFPAAQRKFDVRSYRAPRLKSQIVFVRDGYGPGDEVSAGMHVERAEGGIPIGAKVTATARIDGEEVYRGSAAVNAAGNVGVSFKLPPSISRGEGTLALATEDGGVVETAAKTIPILLQTVDLQIYPEGGDLVSGLPNRVYFEARTPAQKPADLAGEVLDSGGKSVTAFRSEHEGRGRFSFTPVKGEKYTLKVSEPAGIKTTFPLPGIKDAGAVVSVAQDVCPRGAAMHLNVASSEARRLKVTLAQHGVEVGAVTSAFDAGVVSDISFTLPSAADGVFVATIWDESGRPLAERLVFRQPSSSLNVKLIADQSMYVPGGLVHLKVVTTDETGKAVGAVVGLTVTDDSVQEMIEKREQAPRLPVMVFLEDDVRDLADAHVYLDPNHPKAALATDLLLGTQGWRRFAFTRREQFVQASGDAAHRVLADLQPVQNWGMMGGAGGGGELFEDGAADGPRRGGRPMPMAMAAPRAMAAAPQNAAAARIEDRNKAEGRARPVAARNDDDKAPNAERQFQAAIQPQQLALSNAKSQKQKRLAFAPAGKPMADDLRDEIMPAAEPMVQVVREYAHPAWPGRKPGDREDFAETLYWHAGVKTDAKTGEASVAFALSDAVTSFRASADAFDAGGALGSATSSIQSVKPFYVEPKLPLEVTTGDVIRLPVAVVNATGSDINNTSVNLTGGKGIAFSSLDPLTIKANARDRRLVDINLAGYTGKSEVVLTATSGDYTDKVTRWLVVQPQGFPIEIAYGGLLGPDAGISKEIEVPQTLIPKSLTASVAVYPTPLANMTEALRRLMQEPYGCFEQTTSTTYPLVMAQQYFLSHAGVDPDMIEKSRDLLSKGYARLASFECKNKGYEWFGEDPGHEALSAYGLMEFNDMSVVRDVDRGMLANTRAWLLKQRDGQGGFKHERRALHTWAPDPACSNGYITWALLESGEKDLSAEVSWVKREAMQSANSYAAALGANVAALSGDSAVAKQLMEKLSAKQTKDGWVDGATETVVGSRGEALQVETTALATLAWLRDPSYAGNVERSMHWLAESCKSGRFGSTQSTVLALRAVVAYDKARATPKAPGNVQVVVDGRQVGSPVAFDPQTQGAIQLPDIAEFLSPGKHAIELKMAGGSSMPFNLAFHYNATQPVSSDQCRVAIEVALRDREITEGAVTEASVVVTNRAKETIPAPVAIVGIPGGLEVRHDQLKELVKSGKIAAYEVIGREVVLYWRELSAGQAVSLPISLVAAVPGTYTAPASRAYEYYADEFKTWVGGVSATITPTKG